MSATLHLFCGKIAAGKSTKARELSAQPMTVLIRQDEWLAALYPGELHTLQDYMRYCGRLNPVMAAHVEALLRAGLSVALDFPANTPAMRRWMKDIVVRAGVPHTLYYFDVSDAECKRRLKERNSTGSHEFSPNEADFDTITKYFVPPSPEEEFNVVTVVAPVA